MSNRLAKLLSRNENFFPGQNFQLKDGLLSEVLQDAHCPDGVCPVTQKDLVAAISTQKILADVPNPIPPNYDYIDPYSLSASITAESREIVKTKQNDPQFLADTQCPLTDDELLDLTLIFTLWTGIDIEGVTPDGREYRAWTVEEVLNELNNVRGFMKNELNTIFGLSGIMAQINQCMFMNELENFTEEQLMGYAALFHLDLRALDDFQAVLTDNYVTTVAELGDKEDAYEQLREKQEANQRDYVHELRAIILQFKIDWMDRLRLWRWREEVVLGRIETALDDYPGVEITNTFESAGEIFANGIDSYFLRVGNVKRETLMDRYNFVELYHMAGMLATYYPREVEFSTGMDYEDMADTVVEMIETIDLDHRQLLTPLGFYTIHNSERQEVQYNFKNKEVYFDSETLLVAAGHAGIDAFRQTEVWEPASLDDSRVDDLDRDLVMTIRNDKKPDYVLAEEIISQYVSPQFFSAIEAHRNYHGALTSMKTLSRIIVEPLTDLDFIFYGVGDGVSLYRVYTPKELTDVFTANEDFFDPYSIRDHLDQPQKWSRFSVQSINRLMRIVIPVMTERIQGDSAGAEKKRQALSDLSEAIEKTFESREQERLRLEQIKSIDELTFRDYIHPRMQQARIVNRLKQDLDVIRSDLAQFLVYLFNTGMQFSDWSTTMTRIDENVIQVARDYDPNWKHVDPETTANLNEKIFKMLTLDFEKFSHVMMPRLKREVPTEEGDLVTENEDYDYLLRELRLVKHYKGAYRLDWDDELGTIEGHFFRMRKANELSYFQHLKTSGNWLMATAQYYAIEILGISLTYEELVLTDVPNTPEQLITF